MGEVAAEAELWQAAESAKPTLTVAEGAPMLMVLGSIMDPTAGAASGARVACAPTVVPGRITALAPTVPWSPILMGAQAMLVLSTAMLVAILQVSPFTTLHCKQAMSQCEEIFRHFQCRSIRDVI